MTEITRRQFAVYLLAVIAVVLLGGRALRADAGAPPRLPPGGLTAAAPDGSASGVTGATGSEAVSVTRTEERVLVHVAGRVRRPGVYELADGARVRDALDAAGGGRDGADLDGLNLAAKVSDGQQVLVARRGTGAAGGAVPGAAGAPGTAVSSAPSPPAAAVGAGAPTVDVNTADAGQLELLNGVGPAIAAKIVDWRTQNGPFRTAEDLALVPGIGPKKLEAMRAQVGV